MKYILAMIVSGILATGAVAATHIDGRASDIFKERTVEKSADTAFPVEANGGPGKGRDVGPGKGPGRPS